MGSIIALDKRSISRIRAGEVIERPLNAVKELIENSLDARATRIEVEIERGGFDLIRVADNGRGMPASDARICTERHTTSKIASDADIDCVRTLGFRGEALHSILAVARVELSTNDDESSPGSKLKGEGGVLESIESVPRSRGTEISLRELFFNTPARRRFQKSAQAETGAISHLVTRYALAFPQVRFTFVNNSKKAFESYGTGEPLDALLAVYKKDAVAELIPVELEDMLARVEGFISRPTLTRGARRDISLFVNGRLIEDRGLSVAVERAYHELIPRGRFPLALLRIWLEPSLVDVNVHPKKAQVRFSDARQVHSAVHRAVATALASGSQGASFEDPQALSFTDHNPREGFIPAASQVRLPMAPLPRTASKFEARFNRSGEGTSTLELGGAPPVHDASAPSAGPLIGLGQYLDTYIVVVQADAVYLVDQHNFQERLTYDRLIADYEARTPRTQQLLFPVTVTLEPDEAELLRTKLEYMRGLGFEIEEFGEKGFIVRGAPEGLDLERIGEIVEETAAEIGEVPPDERERRMLLTLACKSSIKAGERLSIEEVRGLIEGRDLSRYNNCPHGRPCVIRLDRRWFDRSFGR